MEPISVAAGRLDFSEMMGWLSSKKAIHTDSQRPLVDGKFDAAIADPETWLHRR